MRPRRPRSPSPLKASQWRKRGYVIPKDLDGAHRVHSRLDGQNVIRSDAQQQIKEDTNG